MKHPLVAMCLLVQALAPASHAETGDELAESTENAIGEATDGADASNPTAAVNFQDLRYRYFDLDGNADTHSFETEGAYVFNPRFKVTNELRYVDTDVTGNAEQDFQELKIKAIHLTDGTPFGINAKYVLGVEWLKDLGDFEEGTGTGADSIAPLIGIGWVPDETNFIITLVQYFHSYTEDSARPEDVRQTSPRLIWIRKIPSLRGWFKADLKMAINHEDGDDFSQTLELQFGTMLTPSLGLYGELLLGDDVLDSPSYDVGAGVALRYMY
jgi:hypothetical protein